MPKTDQIANGLPGEHQRVKYGNQRNGLQKTAEESKMKLIHDDPKVRSVPSMPLLQVQHRLREFHNAKILYFRA